MTTILFIPVFIAGYVVGRLLAESAPGPVPTQGRVFCYPVVEPPALPKGATDDQWDAWDEAMDDWRDRLVENLLPCEKCGGTRLDLTSIEDGILCVDCGWNYTPGDDEYEPLHRLAERWNTRYILDVDDHHGS